MTKRQDSPCSLHDGGEKKTRAEGRVEADALIPAVISNNPK